MVEGVRGDFFMVVVVSYGYGYGYVETVSMVNVVM